MAVELLLPDYVDDLFARAWPADNSDAARPSETTMPPANPEFLAVPAATKDLPDIRARELWFRACHRSTPETEQFLGSFAEVHLTNFDSTQLDRFEALLECTDSEFFAWIIDGGAPPPQHDHDVMHLLRDFSRRRQRNARATRPQDR